MYLATSTASFVYMRDATVWLWIRYSEFSEECRELQALKQAVQLYTKTVPLKFRNVQWEHIADEVEIFVVYRRKRIFLRINWWKDFKIGPHLPKSLTNMGLSFFLFWGGTPSLRMSALRPASQAGPMRNPRERTIVVGGAENAGVENAGVENAGAIKYGKPSE